MNIKDLKPNPDNPRAITEKKLAMLQKALAEFGDLGGIVFNRQSGQLVGGHQRITLFKSQDAQVVIETRYKKPTRTGTLAEGYVLVDGERFSYREVHWDDQKEKAANIAANKGAGAWDIDKLKEFMVELQDFQLDVNLTMFDQMEVKKLFGGEKKGKSVEFEAKDFDEFTHQCPRCGFEYNDKL